MLQKPFQCQSCILYKQGIGFSRPEGRCSNGVLIIGESLGSSEVSDALPFRPWAEAGSALQTAFRFLGLDRSQFGMWNLIACVTYNTYVTLADGTQKPIGTLVKENYSGNVLSYDEFSGQYVSRKVLRVFKTPRNKRKLYKVSYEGAKNHSRGVLGTVATEDHPFLTNEGWKRADELNGKFLNIGPQGYGLRALQTIVGTLLGDSHIQRNCATLTMSHCKQQLEWIKCKARILGVPLAQLEQLNTNGEYTLHTKANRKMDSIRKQFYVDGKKSLPTNIVDLLTPQAIATWYLDDGSINIYRQNKRTRVKLLRKNPTAEFATCSFTVDELVDLAKGLKRFDIDTYIYEGSKGYLRLKLTTDNTIKLIQLIGKYVPPSMRYKLGNIPCENYDPSLWEFEGIKSIYRKAKVTRVFLKGKRNKHRNVYCLEVEDTNNFITPAGVTHNCQPPFNNLENAPYEEEAITHCKVHFNTVINRFKPKVILALGNLPFKYLWKRDKVIDDYISQMPTDTKEDKKAKTRYLKNFKIGSMRGYFLESHYGIPVIASWHPSYITRDKGRTQLGILMRDINAALMMARGQVPVFKSNYDENPTIEKAEDFFKYCKANPNLVIAHDIETPMTILEIDESEVEYENENVRDIDSIQFSVKEGTGIFIPYHGDYIHIVRDILALPNPKIGWNSWKFDEVNLQYHLGKDSIRGENHDVMWMWKWLHQDFVKTGRALQFAASTPSPEFPAWKHLAPLSPEEYGCLDVDATLRIYNYLEKNFNNPQFRFKNPLTLKVETQHTKTVMQGYLDDVVNLRPILKEITDRGFPIDLKEREKFRQQIQEEQAKVLEDLQEQFPDNLRTIKPTLGYKFVPSEVFELIERFNKMQDFKNDGKFIIFDDEKTGKHLLEKYIETHTRKFDEEEKEETTGLIVKEFTLPDNTKERRYCRMEKFKPGSPKQVISYIKFKGYKVPTKRDKIKGERDTSDKEHLKPLWEETGDDFLYNIIYVRELDNMMNTYVGTGTKGGWKTGSDNRVHAKFLFIPATGQLSTSPNIQNAPGHGSEFSSEGYLKLAQQFRRIVAAKSGHSLLSIDWSAFHINTLAFEAEDADYMKIGRIDPHSFLASEILLTSLPMRLPKLMARKPQSLTDLEWKTGISLFEETLDKLKDFNKWLSYDEEKLQGILKWFKKYHKQLRDSQAKPAILGMGFGMKAGKFYQRNRSAFKSKAEPERIIGLMQGRFPKTFLEFPEKMKSLADSQTYLISRYGYIRRFFNVYDWRLIKRPRPPKGDEKVIRNSKGEYWLRKDGDSANECIAFLPANDAFGTKKEKMRELNYYKRDGIIRNLNKEFSLVNEIHDDLIFEVEDSKINEAAKLVQDVMESPAKYLVNLLCPRGLVTKTEIKVGKNWGAWHETDNVLGMKGLVV